MSDRSEEKVTGFDYPCEDCGERAAVTGEDYCPDCRDNRAEAAWERRCEDGECFRGGEAAAYEAEQQAWIQRNLK